MKENSHCEVRKGLSYLVCDWKGMVKKMKVEKKVISHLTKCYSIAPLLFQEKEHFLVASEKMDECRLFDLEGNQKDVVWSQPGGVMSMVQVPGTDGVFLATHQFYSPDDAQQAKIVLVSPEKKGGWKIRTLVELPFVHRIDILTREGQQYLIACTVKSGCEYKDDWRSPGKVYAALLPEHIEECGPENPLELQEILGDMPRNHGYCRVEEDGEMHSLISSDKGIFLLTPPEQPKGKWKICQMLWEASSDAVLVDFDGDGEKELGVIAPFHGDRILIYKKNNGRYQQIYEYEKPAEFSHAIYGGQICGRPMFIIGYREGERNLLAFWWDSKQKKYVSAVIDHDCGPANFWHFVRDGKDILVSANRETDEIAMYTFTDKGEGFTC